MNAAVILASGTGERFKSEIPKQFVNLAGKPILLHTFEIFEKHPHIDFILVVCHPEWVVKCKKWLVKSKKPFKVIPGGATRMESSWKGIKALPKNIHYILIHDGVRPFLNTDIITQLINVVKQYKAVDTVIPSADTIVEVKDAFISGMPDRSHLRRGQTPQAFEVNLIKKAYQKALKEGFTTTTDDCRLVMRMGVPIACVNGSVENIKITNEWDLFCAERFFQIQTEKANLSQPDLQNKIIVVIGGLTGIGRAVCNKIKRLKGKAIPLSRRTKPSLDITQPTQVESVLNALYKEKGSFYSIINSAGVLYRNAFPNQSTQNMNEIISVNLMGSIYLAKYGLPLIQKGGHLINLISSSSTRGRASYAVYSASKAAVLNLTQGLAEEFPDIHINAISPQRTATPLRFKAFGQEDQSSLLKPEEVADAILSILNLKATGQVFDVRLERQNKRRRQS